MIYEIYQIRLSETVMDATQWVRDHEALIKVYPEYKAHLKTNIGVYDDSFFQFYSHVSDIEAHTLDDVFRIGNIGPESSITRYKPMHSLSVGDIIFDGERFHFVDRIGFRDITREKVAA